MRILALAFPIFILTGCINPTRICGIENTSGWVPMQKAPANSTELLALVRKNPAYKQPHAGKQSYWLSKGDEYLLCRANPRLSVDECFSAGWRMSKTRNSWQAELLWNTECVD
jgi:hypothetical protein